MRRKRLLSVVAALATGLSAVIAQSYAHGGGPTAFAHPLGNFTVNRYARIEVSDGALQLRYVLDMAEIPALQERQRIDADGDGSVSADEERTYVSEAARRLRDGLRLTLNGDRVELATASTSLSFPAGQAGLETLRLVVDYRRELPAGWEQPPQQVAFEDTNYGDRIGWREVVVRGGSGARISESDVGSEDQTNELRSYPEGGLSSPLDVSAANFTFVPGDGAAASGPQTTAVSAEAPKTSGNAFTSLVSNERQGVPFVLAALAIAVGFGALHALSPGHGKTVVAAYLVGERGTIRHALLLGLTVTATHTSSVFALGFATLYASQFIVPERLYPWLSLSSGAVVLALGAVLIIARTTALLRSRRAHGHEHDHDHAHSHAPSERISLRSLLALGVSGGLLPCPSALVVLLGAISLHRVGLGLLLVVAFSVGLAAVLTGIGLALVLARRLLGRVQQGRALSASRALRLAGRLAPGLPAVSALAVSALGLVMTLRALDGVLG